jgi:hypothetical protein
MKHVLRFLTVPVLVISGFSQIGFGNSELPSCFEAWKTGDATIGYSCQTEYGHEYQRVDRPGFGRAWKQLSTGLIWNETQKFPGAMPTPWFAFYDDAWDFCESLGAHLPTKFEIAGTYNSGRHNPMKWINAYTLYTSNLRDGNPTFAITMKGTDPGGFGPEGNADRRLKLDDYTVCVDDSEALKPITRPSKPAPIQKNR